MNRTPKSKTLRKLIPSLQKNVASKRKSSIGSVISRRKFIRDTASATAGIAIVGTELSSCAPRDKETKIAIIGGGIAGLNCARVLKDANIPFHLYEGSKRCGGRILTHNYFALKAGIKIEFGADFVDSNHQDMLDLAKHYDIDLIDLRADESLNGLRKDTYYFDNRIISEEEVVEEFSKVSDKIAKDIDSLGENMDTADAIRLDHISLADYLAELDCKNWLKELLDSAYVAEFGLDSTEQSCINMLDMLYTDTSEGFEVFGISDERYRIKGGNSTITKHLELDVGEHNISKNHMLKELIEIEDHKYKLIFESGQTILADIVVLTIPFTVLRKMKLKLKNMSEMKRKCIDELGYGNNTKLLLKYKGRPWREAPNKAEGYIFSSKISNGWDESFHRLDTESHSAYACFFGGSYSTKLDELATLNPRMPKFHTWRTELPEEIIDNTTSLLDDIFPGSKNRFAGDHVFANWIDYPYALGSYSCFLVGQWTTIAGYEMQAVDKVFFAGEHCSENFQGYMNGGAETGRRVAESIVKAMK